jgi:hypothetical protein
MHMVLRINRPFGFLASCCSLAIVLLFFFDFVFGGRESLFLSVSVVFSGRDLSAPVVLRSRMGYHPAQSVVFLKWWKLVGSLLQAAFSIVNGVAIREHVAGRYHGLPCLPGSHTESEPCGFCYRNRMQMESRHSMVL